MLLNMLHVTYEVIYCVLLHMHLIILIRKHSTEDLLCCYSYIAVSLNYSIKYLQSRKSGLFWQ